MVVFLQHTFYFLENLTFKPSKFARSFNSKLTEVMPWWKNRNRDDEFLFFLSLFCVSKYFALQGDRCPFASQHGYCENAFPGDYVLITSIKLGQMCNKID